MNKKLVMLPILALVTLMLAPTASASIQPPQVMNCSNFSWDSDHDGHSEAWRACNTGGCGCNCPVVGGMIELTALGQDNTVLVYGSCSSGYGTGSEASNNPESTGVTFTPILYPAGLGPVLNEIQYVLNSLVSCISC